MTKIGFQDRLLLNAGQKYCRMLQREHSAILLTLIKLPFVIKVFVLSIFEWPLKTGFTVDDAYFSDSRTLNSLFTFGTLGFFSRDFFFKLIFSILNNVEET